MCDPIYLLSTYNKTFLGRDVDANANIYATTLLHKSVYLRAGKAPALSCLEPHRKATWHGPSTVRPRLQPSAGDDLAHHVQPERRSHRCRESSGRKLNPQIACEAPRNRDRRAWGRRSACLRTETASFLPWADSRGAHTTR